MTWIDDLEYAFKISERLDIPNNIVVHHLEECQLSKDVGDCNCRPKILLKTKNTGVYLRKETEG